MSLVIVAGAIANKPGNGGEAWVRASWARGFRRLGFDVFFVEQLAPEHCVDRDGRRVSFEESVNRAYFASVVEAIGFGDRAALVYGDGAETLGPTLGELADIAGEAALLANISGHLSLPEIFARPGLRAYIDIDPGFTQFWHAAGDGGTRLAGHDLYFTIGENIGRSGCTIPVDGILWHPTRQPVVLEDWPVASTTVDPGARFTTVGSWRGSFGPVRHAGRDYGVKAHEFRKFLSLPERSDCRFEVALAIHPDDGRDLEALLRSGWDVVDPGRVAGDPSSFREYVRGSTAEFSVAQGIYVDTWSGWFSDRTARYLASGKPALVQETGFRERLPVGEGLVSFRTLEEAVGGAERIARDYDVHCSVARSIAEEHFDSDRVLGELVERAGVSP